MPPVFFTEVQEKSVDLRPGRENPVERTVITRYYTEFNAEPTTVLNKLLTDSGQGLPPIFYDIEIAGPSYRNVSASSVKPLSLVIQPGSWRDRVDWTVQWEVVPVREPITLLGLNIHDWTSSITQRQEAAEYAFGHRIFGTSPDSAGAFSRHRQSKDVITYNGSIPGQINYSVLRTQMANNPNVTSFSYTYTPSTDITTVTITLEEPELLDGRR